MDDLAEAKAWYADVLGREPEGAPSTDGAVACWGVEDIDAALARLLEKGATRRTEVREVGEDIRTATVEDPFGNALGVIENPHFEASE